MKVQKLDIGVKVTQAVSPKCPSKRRTIAVTMTRTKPMYRANNHRAYVDIKRFYKFEIVNALSALFEFSLDESWLPLISYKSTYSANLKHSHVYFLR